jgi:hypothetical protein
VRGSRPGEPARTARRTSDDDTAANEVGDGERAELSAVGRRHLSEGAIRLHDVTTFEPITDADRARSVARDVGRRVREDPRQAEGAQAHVAAAAVQQLLG